MSEIVWRETRYLPVPLTPEELCERGEMLAKLLADGAELAAQHKKSRDAMKEAETQLDGQIGATAAVIRERVETRPVPVELRCILALGLVEMIRTDTGEHLGTRAATPDDKARAQLQVPGIDGP